MEFYYTGGGEFPDDCECGIKFVQERIPSPPMLADQIGTSL